VANGGHPCINPNRLSVATNAPRADRPSNMNEANSNTNTTTSHLSGGVVRVQHNVEDTRDMPDLGSLANSHAGGRYTIGGEVESFGITKTNGADSLAEARANAKGILDTARRPDGGVAGQLNASSVVLIDGVETNLATAERLGYVSRNVDGNYVETGRSTEAHQSGQPLGAQQSGNQADHADDTVELHPEAVAKINELVADVPQYYFDSAINRAINFGVDDLDYREMARHMNTTEGDAMQRVEFIMASYRVAADRAVSGIIDAAEADAFHAWAAENATKEQARAMTQLVFGGNTADFKALAAKYMKSTNPDDALLKQAGFETKTENGTRMIRIQGMWTSLAAAVKNGWV